MDTYFWIVCPGFQAIKLLVGYLYISVTADSDSESQRFNFYLQILSFRRTDMLLVCFVLSMHAAGTKC